MKKLGFGLMRLPLLDQNDPTSVDIAQVNEMVDRFLARGFTYFDTAWMYHAFASEAVVKTVLVDRHPRESFTLTTKLHANFISAPEDRDKVFNAQLEKTGAGYFDYYLIHDIEAPFLEKYEKLDCFNWLLDKKAQGLVKHVGFSFHDSPELLDKVLTDHPEMEFVQLQINYLDWESSRIRSKACYEVAVKHGKQIIVMEPVKGGALARVPQEAADLFHAHDPGMSVPSWAIRFAASLPQVMVVLSGMSDLAQMEDNLGYMEDFQPLTAQEVQLCHKAAALINGQIAIPCTGCSYCTEGCPMRIAIPQYFSLYNDDVRKHLGQASWNVDPSNYNALVSKFGKAGDCVACGQCEGVCPQHLSVIRHLRAVAEHYE